MGHGREALKNAANAVQEAARLSCEEPTEGMIASHCLCQVFPANLAAPRSAEVAIFSSNILNLLAEAIRPANSVRSPPEYYARHGRGGGNTAVFQDLAAGLPGHRPAFIGGFRVSGLKFRGRMIRAF
jgi:hypothetical protein